MNADPSRFDNPGLALGILLLQSLDQGLAKQIQFGLVDLAGCPQDHNSGRVFRGKMDRRGKVQVQGDQATPLFSTGFRKFAILGLPHLLFGDREDIVSRRLQLGGLRPSQILVEFEFQRADGSGISTKRSRAISEPYAMHAIKRISSFLGIRSPKAQIIGMSQHIFKGKIKAIQDQFEAKI